MFLSIINKNLEKYLILFKWEIFYLKLKKYTLLNGNLLK